MRGRGLRRRGRLRSLCEEAGAEREKDSRRTQKENYIGTVDWRGLPPK